ncbi:MAG: phosphoribosylformylglycinamidine synthase subunit PurL [bacterium JZ-2024 1]
MPEGQKDIEQLLKQVNLSWEEYERAKKMLGREPNVVEIGMIAALWSEHCSYKSSRIHLKKFPTQGEYVVQGPGENAGVVRISENVYIAMKIESHNHPSAVEPFQGAATGVGGIIRDVLAVGAFPVALLDSLRFGPLTHPRARYLFHGVVGGIAHYGNCVGIPTVGGEVYFAPPYLENPLVNVLCAGKVRPGKIVTGKAEGEGNLYVLLGAKTGRDGIHGATFASAELTEESEQMRPAVQIGDPFREKLLIEAIQEILARVKVIGIQDLGAAGLTGATVEMAHRGSSGVEIFLDNVHLRETGMNAYELMLSESQERMMLVVSPEDVDKVMEIARKWGLDASVVGKVTGEPYVRIYHRHRKEADLPIALLTSDAPVYDRERKPGSAYRKKKTPPELPALPARPEKIFEEMVRHPDLASKKPVFRQYDHMVQIQMVRYPGSDSACLRLPGENAFIALTTDGNGYYCHLDPYEGGKYAVAEAAQNIVSTGAKPVAITDCLNFGNPENPEVMWQFIRVVQGIADAARYLNIPIISGNVSFYNESPSGSVYPTPVVGMLGIFPQGKLPLKPGFHFPGSKLYLVGNPDWDLSASTYFSAVWGMKAGKLPKLHLQREKETLDAVFTLIQKDMILSAKDISEGGLFTAIVEELSFSTFGVSLKIPDFVRWDEWLFSETPGRFLLTCSEKKCLDFEEFLARKGIWFYPAGVVIEEKKFLVEDCQIDMPLGKLLEKWYQALTGM